jgi:glycogen debranching enzyme
MHNWQHVTMMKPQNADLHWLLRHWVVMCPMEVGLATPDQAAQSFDRLLSPEFCNEWGMYLHPERQDVMSINTGLLALSLVRYGRIDDALRLVNQMAGALNVRMPGAISEALPGEWCFLQLWSALGMISPLVEGILGHRPACR